MICKICGKAFRPIRPGDNICSSSCMRNKMINPEDYIKDMKSYWKKPLNIKAVQMDEEFTIKTMEGVMRGKEGDYLIRGIKGEFYPCDMDIFNDTYETV